jgi:hypothetical protein
MRTFYDKLNGNNTITSGSALFWFVAPPCQQQL